MKKKEEEEEKNEGRKKIAEMILTILFYFILVLKMDNVTKNRIHNILYRYGIDENADNFNKIAEVIFKKEIEIYKVIFNLIDACIIINENEYSLKIEICSGNHRYLLDDIAKKFFTKVVKRRRASDFRSNLFFTVLIYKY